MNKYFSGINWKYGFGELLLIFLGITAALYFNNWNEARQRAKLERETLLEIHNGVSADLADIEGNIEGYTFRQTGYEFVVEHLEQQLPPSEAFLDTIRFLRGFTYFISNSGPFETLKSRGLELISNKEIRLAIAAYYDQNHEWLKVNETKHHEFYKNEVIPMYLRYFEVSNRFKPYNYQELLNDKEAHQILNWAINDMAYLIQEYRKLSRIARELLKAIEEEVGTL